MSTTSRRRQPHAEGALAPFVAQALAFPRDRPGAGRTFVGIDLGTTNSTAAVFDAGAALRGDLAGALRLVPVRQATEQGVVESPLLPSVVAEVEPGLWRVGQGARQARRRGLVRGRDLFFSTKSEMGLGREPFYPLAAAERLDCPYKVAGLILAELRAAVVDEHGADSLANAVVTVPASFQLAARKDTFRAAAAAGLVIGERALLDEPNAALLDFLLTDGPAAARDGFDLAQPRIVLVFDFGGGTCDVSVVRVQAHDPRSPIAFSNLSISRYESLGGDNIDAAIAEEVLLPELLRQNGLAPLDLGWSDKRDVVLPQLLPVAEALKRDVCASGKDARQPSFGVDIPASPKGGNDFVGCVFERPSLTVAQLDAVLEPFLDRDFLFSRGSELNPVTSIFTPITDALDRARLQANDVDAVLLAGGSSLVPRVGQAVAGFFPKARLLRFPDADRTLYAVARGAALHSFFLHGLGRPLLKPIAQETLGLLTRGRAFVPLIGAGSELPFPADGDGAFATYAGLSVPKDLADEVQIVLAADGADKVLAVAHLLVTEVHSAGQPIRVGYRLDANKILELRASIASDPEASCEIVLDNPLCATRVHGERQRRILVLEQEVAQATADHAPQDATLGPSRELAGLCFQEGRFERAIDWARSALAARGRPEAWILNLMGNAYDRLGAPERSEKAYRAAIAAEGGFVPAWFNLSLALARQGRDAAALEAVDRAIELGPTSPAYRVQRGLVLQRARKDARAAADFLEARRLFDAQGLHSDFDREWRASLADALFDRAAAQRLRQASTTTTPEPLRYDPEKLPAMRGTLERVKR